MNPIFIVLPILTLLMFDLGLTLKPQDFVFVAKRPKAALVGLTGQLVILPLVAYLLATALNLPAYYFIGIVLVACCPGGSSSNIFSLLAKGDVALSVSMTAVSSIVTLFTVPVIMQYTTASVGNAVGVTLPVGNLLAQNCVTMLLPIVLGIAVRHFFTTTANCQMLYFYHRIWQTSSIPICWIYNIFVNTCILTYCQEVCFSSIDACCCVVLHSAQRHYHECFSHNTSLASCPYSLRHHSGRSNRQADAP